VSDVVPTGAVVMVVSKGDADLVDLPGRVGWHFPQDANGTYAGHHPADSDACIQALEALRARGGTHLVVPATMRWWLDHYKAFHRHLVTHGTVLADQAVALVVSFGGATCDA